MTSLRSPLGKVRARGSAREGAHHWWVQRLSATALIPLTIWFAVSVIRSLSYLDHAGVVEWLGKPAHAIPMLAFVLLALWHVKHGMQAIIEDYVHRDSLKISLIILVTLFAGALALVATFSICKIHFLGY